MQSDNTNTPLKLNKYLINEIDANRGEKSRQAFIKMILTQHFAGANSDDNNKKPKP